MMCDVIDKSRVLVLGNGFLGNAFKRHGFTVWGRDMFDWDVDEYDDNPHNELFEVLDEKRVDYIINCVGLSNTRYCEDPTNWEHVKSVNGNLPSYLSDLCDFNGVQYIHISTGCVYSNQLGVCTEDDFITPMCRYTVSKVLGEYGCNPENDLIIRPRLLFDRDEASGRNNLIEKFYKFNTFLNEFNSVTSLDTIVESIQYLIKSQCVGVYNVSNEGTYTIQQMANHLGFHGESITGDELRKDAELYLVNNVMSCNKLIRDTGYEPRNTLYELRSCFYELCETRYESGTLMQIITGEEQT